MMHRPETPPPAIRTTIRTGAGRESFTDQQTAVLNWTLVAAACLVLASIAGLMVGGLVAILVAWF